MAHVVSGFAPMINNNQYRKYQGLQAITLDGQEIRGEITPLGNFVLVRTKDTLAATSGGVLLPDQVSLDRILSCTFYIMVHKLHVSK